MYRLQTLGGLRIVGQDGKVAFPQRLRMSFLAYLELGGTNGRSRDRLLGMFWPESPEANARHALDQLLSALRKQSDADLLAGPPDPVRLNPEALHSDRGDFERLLESGNLQEAIGFYRGPFLAGFLLGGTTGFDEWADSERIRLARLYASALERLGSEAEALADLEAARNWWTRLAETDPLDGRGALGLIRVLAESGDPAGALAHARVHESLLREELGAEPDPALSQLTSQIRAGTYRKQTIPRARPAPPTEETHQPDTAEPPAPRSEPSRLSPRNLVFAAIIIVMGSAALWLSRGATERGDASKLGQRRLVVTPFTILNAEPQATWLAEGVADLLSTNLAGTPGLQIVDYGRAVRVARSVEPTDTVAATIAHATGSDAVVTGRVIIQSAGQIEIRAELLERSSGTRTTARAQGPLDSLDALVGDVTAGLLLGYTREGFARTLHLARRPFPALQAYLSARAWSRRGQPDSAVTAFTRALRVHPTFPLAGLELAVATGWLSSKQIASEEGRQTVGLATGPGAARRSEYQELWRSAIATAQRGADQLGPADQALLTAVVGRRYPQSTPVRERIADWEVAVGLAPDRAETRVGYGLALQYQGPSVSHHDAWPLAQGQYLRALELDPDYPYPWFALAELAALRADTTSFMEYSGRFLATVPTGEASDYMRWHTAALRGSPSARRVARSALDTLSSNVLGSISWTAQVEGIALADAIRAQDILLRRSTTRAGRRLAYYDQALLSLNRGRPREAEELLEVKGAFDPYDFVALFQSTRFGLYWDGDIASSAVATHQLAVLTDRTTPADTTVWTGPAYHRGLWFLALADLEQGKLGRVSRTLATLRQPTAPQVAGEWAQLLEAKAQIEAGGATAMVAAERLDSLSLAGCCGVFVHLVAALAKERVSDTAGALRIIRRGRWADPPDMLSRYLREESRLLLALGDSAGARQALNHLVALSNEPELERRRVLEKLAPLLRAPPR